MFNVEQLLGAGGIIGILIVAAIVFAESGLLIGFFLPGDTLLFGAGLIASQGSIPIVPLVLATVLAAILGDNVGYSIGRRAGPRLFKKQDSLLFHHEHIKRAEEFYEKHGGKTIILARFTPVVRTFAPVVAGVGKMPRKRFMMFNVIGGALWGAGITLLGYHLGSRIPGLDNYIEYVLIGVVLLTIGLSFLHILKEPRSRKIFVNKIKHAARTIFLNKKIN
jgi:membrane-associated protein